jgi:putative transposase
MPDHVHILGGGGDRVPERKKLDLNAQNVERKLRNFLGYKFWTRGYFVSTVGRGDEMIRTYIKNQEMADKQLDQLQLKLASS